MIRQGDVMLFSSTIPQGARRVDGPVILAYGETTGHAHAVEAEDGVLVEMYEHDGLTYLRVSGGDAFLRHGLLRDTRIHELEHPDHGTLTVPAGTYLVPGQCAWDLERGASRVSD